MNITQEQLAERFGTSPQTISRWENGTSYPDIEMLPTIASFFETSVDALFGCTEEEKKKYCDKLQISCEDAVKALNFDKTVELMREIRRNLKEYQEYWFWGLYNEIWKMQSFRNERVLEEMRLLTEEIIRVCPKDQHFAVIECMANMEDDEHIDTFLDAYASREGMDRSTLLFNRYKMREELDKIEPVRQHVLWMEISHLVSAPNDWQEYLCQDPRHFIWYCETQLDYLNAVNGLCPDKKHRVSGGIEPDLWCTERVLLGLRYTASLAKLENMDAAYDAFDDTIRIIEQVMSISEEVFELGCSSPALKGFTLQSTFHWLEKNGIEYKELCMEHNDWNNWIVPMDYQEAMHNPWFQSMRADKRFDELFGRLERCVVCRDKTVD
ncbi:MAG: helix-turn-helix transcriptional regulator [Clostridia bacterium]|nr:helix-turn-helix transcriptional regulator [Clostridia bacterium]